MKTRKLYLASLLLAFTSVQLAFGWGNATHVYFAKELGAKFGFSNMNEMYGALLPDCFNFVLNEQGQYLYAQTHDNAMPVWLAARNPVQKSLSFGFMTHNQTWGADYTAHIKCFTFPTFVYPPNGKGGYAIEKGVELMPQLVPVVKQILISAGVPELAPDEHGNLIPLAEMLATGIAPELGHDLSETAVDLLVKRNLDRAIGVRMMLAAKCRPANAGELLSAAYANDLATFTKTSVKDASAFIIGAEQEYQHYIIQYGMAFSLPEKQTIALLSAQTVPVAEMFIEAALAGNGFPGIDVTVTQEQVAGLINAAIQVVKPDYAKEVAKTLSFIEQGLRQHGIRNGCQVFAHDANEGAVESADLSTTPETFSLGQNSPNPFNPSTTIGFTLPAQAHVRLTVFNALGQEVASLIDDERPAGSHVVRWDAMNQSSGAYFYRIEVRPLESAVGRDSQSGAGAFVATKRMMLVK
jgi:hypothetical protein